MQHNATQQTTQQEQVKTLSRAEVKAEMKRRRGFTCSSYARLIHRHRCTAVRLGSGEIGGELRQRFLSFFGFSEDEIPYRGERK